MVSFTLLNTIQYNPQLIKSFFEHLRRRLTQGTNFLLGQTSLLKVYALPILSDRAELSQIYYLLCLVLNIELYKVNVRLIMSYIG